MGVFDLVTGPLRWALGASEQAERDVVRHSPVVETRALERELHDAIEATHRACDSLERHVTAVEGLTDSLPALTQSVTHLTDQLAVLLTVTEPAPPDRPSPDREPAPGRPTPQLEIPPYELASALTLERELGVSHVLAQALVRRGLGNPATARDFLDAREEHPPSAFSGIDRALSVIDRHIRSRSRITIHGDYDVDGVCATAIMVRALRALGAKADWFLPARIEDGYGLSLDTVRRLAARGTRLLITVDCAITAVEEVQAARSL